jgi:ribosomal protein L29
VQALIARGATEDLARARTMLAELETRVEDPFRRDLARALTALATPPKTPQEAATLR